MTLTWATEIFTMEEIVLKNWYVVELILPCINTPPHKHTHTPTATSCAVMVMPLTISGSWNLTWAQIRSWLNFLQKNKTKGFPFFLAYWSTVGPVPTVNYTHDVTLKVKLLTSYWGHFPFPFNFLSLIQGRSMTSSEDTHRPGLFPITPHTVSVSLPLPFVHSFLTLCFHLRWMSITNFNCETTS